MRRDPGRREAGFTLLEVLVAFVIAALALTALVEGARRGIWAGEVAGRHEEALSRARSRLAAVLAQPVLQPLEQGGEDGNGFRWQTRVRLLADSAAASLYEVRVAVRWGQGQGVELTSRQLGPGGR